MEQTALRPKPMPGREPPGGASRGAGRRPHTARRGGRRLLTVAFGLLVGLGLLLSGIGIGTVSATVIGMSRMAELQRQAAAGPGAAAPRSAPADRTAPASPAPTPVRPSLGIEAVDDTGPGARVVGVHVPGPGYSAGLVRGDVLLVFGSTRIDSAADLAQAVARARPGREVVLTVRHRSGGYEQLTVVPGVVT
ncbi:PDZ domain-containing protein [Streptomyces spiralis]|uniref:PDZ domain-containing protein n=1 Tax=Streptomyces spiralis TaxID=66376 RepID=A0A919DUH5_9ACTN|nr:PDZ domain-containing protein [Streptomyces spiralis]GHE78996.1 PDZ domain-containing protein [Streptomyces spiralis]